MRLQILIFIVCCFGMLTLSRCLLAAWQWQRVQRAGGVWPILKGGLRIDAIQIAMLAGIPALLSPWLGHYALAVAITGWWLTIAWFLLLLLEVSTPQFIYEYDTRPNRLYVEYLEHPQEVFGMLWKGYKAVIFGGVIILLLAGWLGFRLFGHGTADTPMTWWLRPIVTVVLAIVILLAIRGTLSHRPINPSSVAYCGDSMLNPCR